MNDYQVLFIDTTKGLRTIEAQYCINTLQQMYDLINCRTITMTDVGIGNQHVVIIADDEGLLVEPPKPTAIYYHTRPAIVGNAILCAPSEEDGELRGFTKQETANILENIETVLTVLDPLGDEKRLSHAINIKR